METGKPGLASAPVHISSIAAQTEKRMDIQAPLTAVYIHTVPALPAQPYPQPTAAVREPATLHLAMPPLYSKETLPFLTLHIAGGLQSQPGLSLAAAAPAARPKSAGKHVCPHCGRDCMKPSVLEKHLRCHTGERPYPCTTCGVSFKTQSNLYKHKRTQAHARHSSESEQSSLGSLDSMSSSRETHTSSMSMDEHTDESGCKEKDATLPATTCPAHTTQDYPVKAQVSVSEQSGLTPAGHNTEPKESAKVTAEGENEKSSLTVSRHLPLQRQEATLFSKQWESSVSSGKSQSHESTDSGFSESSDHYPSPASVLPDHSMDSLAESTKEHLEEVTSAQTPSEPGHIGQEPKEAAREQEQKSLEERISKLISENTAVVEDKQLDNVRPRKTVLSKQGSIDLPMPYTYKDSFHFDMRMSNVGSQRNRKPGLYNSIPTQHSTAIEHAPLTRSNSLPFSVTLLQPERSSSTTSYQSHYETLVRRGSSGHINPTNFTIKPVNQQSSTHRPLVRQTAVDCNHATDGLFMNSSVEEACTSSLSCDGDGGDICAEPSSRKFRRKKTQKFAYNKWYMYGGGTFKKLYDVEKGGDNTGLKGSKCVNTEHDVVQGPQKRLSAVHKETATITSITSSSATVCQPGCPPAKPPLISAVDFDLKTNHLHSSSNTLKTPLRKNLSLSVLPLPSVGSLVGLKTSSMSSTESVEIINEDKHTDSTSQLCGAHVPSDRKKQRTDDKIVFSLSMDPDPKTVTHPPPSVSGSVPQQDINLSYTIYQKNQQHSQLKGGCFTPCIINANASSVNGSLSTSIASMAKTSFLPKYQLKLPNATEPDSNSSPPAVYKSTGNDGCTFISDASPSNTEQSSRLVTSSETTCGDPVTLPQMQTCDNKKTICFNSTQTPCTATTLCQAKLSRFSETATFGLPVIHRQVAATTITTTCLKDYQQSLCSTLIQPSKPASDPVPMHLPRPVASVVADVPSAPTTNSANIETSAVAIPPSSQNSPNSNPPVSHSELSPALDQLSPVNRTFGGSNTSLVPCHTVPFDKVQPVGQNVFHVHTADLQICLQIISDEQLALIEPQIERQAGCSISQSCDGGVLAPEMLPNKAQSSMSVEISRERGDHPQQGNQKELDDGLPKLTTESIKPPLSLHFGKVQPNIHMAEHSNCNQSTVSAESKPLETQGLMLHPHKCSNVSMATQTSSSVGDVMSTAASLIGAKSETHQTSEEEHALCVNYTENQIVLDRRVSLSQTLPGQHSLKEDQISPRSELLCKESQKSSPVSLTKCKAPQAATYCPIPPEPTDTVKPAIHANRGCDRVGPLDNSAPSQEMAHSESKDIISSTHSGEQFVQFTSVSSTITVERPKDATAVSTSIQSPAAGIIEGASLLDQKEQAWAHEGTPGQPDSRACRVKQSQAAQEENHSTPHEWHGDGEVTGENKTDQGEDRKVKVDASKNSWLSEQHVKHLSQTNSGMSENPPQSLQQAPSTSKNLFSPSSNSQTHLFNSQYPLLEINNFYVSQNQWENSGIHSHPTQIHGKSILSEPTKAPAPLKEPQSTYSQTDSTPQQTHLFSHVDQKQTLSMQQGNATKGDNSTAGSCCTKINLGSHKSLSLSPEVKSSFNTHHCRTSHSLQDSRSKAEWTENTQTSSNSMVNNNTGPATKSFIYSDPEQDTRDWPPNDYTSQSSNSGRPDKYQSFFLTGQFHGFQTGECLTSGVRPVQSCQDYSEDTSSSDDEGKLIIEL